VQYEKLLNEASGLNVVVSENPMKSQIRGLYGDNIIWLNRGLPTHTDKVCVLAEEMGHYHTSSGDILDQKKTTSIKQEKRAKNWGYEKLIPLKSFVEASREGISNRYELAEFLEVIEDFLDLAIDHYKEKYGLYTEWENYLIYFDPLGVLKLFED